MKKNIIYSSQIVNCIYFTDEEYPYCFRKRGKKKCLVPTRFQTCTGAWIY